MSATPDVDEIHVLQETLSRVSQLTAGITQEADTLREVSQHARRALAPQQFKHEHVSGLKDNLVALLKQVQVVEDVARRLAATSAVLEKSVNEVGLEEYVMNVLRAYQISKELRTKPQYELFVTLAASARGTYQNGVATLIQQLKRYASAVFVPTDASAGPPQLNADDLGALKQLVQTIDQFRGTSESVNAQITAVLDAFYTGCMDALRQQAVQRGSAGVQKYVEISIKLVLEISGALEALFGPNGERRQLLIEWANVRQQKDVKELQKAVQRSSQQAPRPRATTTKTPPPAVVVHAPPPGVASAVTAAAVPATAAVAVSAAAAAAAAPRTPVSPPRPASQPPAPVVPSPAAAAPQSPAPSAGSFPGSESSSRKTKTASLGASTAPAWTVFELFETQESVPEPQLAAAQQGALQLLSQQFVEVYAQCRKGAITSEHGVSGASLHVMKIIRSVCAHHRGVEKVLSIAATREYIAKPLPAWAANTDPTPAARAHPMSLFFSDLLECYYQTLHAVAAEQLRQTPKVGTFMLTNLTAVEHFIADSKQDTLATVARKSELMDIMGPIALHRVQRLVQLSFKEYLTDWSKLAPFLMEATVTSSQPGKLSSKDREAVKEKFRRFNSEFEELLEQQRRAPVADPALRQAMSQEVKKLLRALYFKFYDKHCSGDFTKNINKYIKWDKEEFDRALDF